MDDIDRTQEVDERMRSAMKRKVVDRNCLQCGRKLPAEVLSEDPDAMVCAGPDGCAGE